MRKTAIFALVLIALGFGYFYISNQYSSTPMEAVERVRSEINGQLLHEVKTDQGKVLFMLRHLQNGQTLNAEYVQKTPLLGWKWGWGGGHTVPHVSDNDPDSFWTEQYFPSTKGTDADSPFPLLFGVIQSAQIDAIHVYSYATNESFTASVMETGGPGIRLWYLYISEEQGTRFKLIAQTEDQEIISTKISES
ncbi:MULTISPECIES: hypothetical protein [Paenibacillus]|uniref:hypothetical protein n=1 Tax=Paenibacillus TaxID=44249 RepID=UPI0001AFD3D6|nr:hypothetical protein [Paenibacillus sp. oral taxon 786]EES74926.1 hypothetical protein POTG_00157 [Paenibacillus sp. oral taxon 786 str. D14]